MAKKKNTQNIEEDIFSHIENNKNINPDIQGCVQKKSKSYRFTSDEESWNKKINKIIEIAENQRRWPSLSSGNEEEKKLAKWWFSTKYHASKETEDTTTDRMSPKHALQVKEIVIRFSNLNRSKKWDSRFRQVELKLLASRRVWSMSNASEEQKKLINWWHRQKHFLSKYKKGFIISGMNEERAKKIERLMSIEKPIRKKNISK